MLSQSEADRLMRLNKKKADNKYYSIPTLGNKIEIPILSFDETESFTLDINSSSLNLKKHTLQERYEKIYILVRLDINGIHTNPPAEYPPLPIFANFIGMRIDQSHLHLYVEGFYDKWAFPIDPNNFSNLNDIYQTFNDFCSYCNIVDPPIIDKELYS
jgi:hypothetical protein